MAAEYYQRITVHEAGDVTVVRFRDRQILDELYVQQLAEEFFGLVENTCPKKILLNFAGVEYMSSAALGKLINLHKKVRTSGGCLSLCNVIPQIWEVFTITKLDKHFETEEYVDDLDDEPDDDDPDSNLGGVPARLKPPKPSGSGTVSLQPPTSDVDS